MVKNLPTIHETGFDAWVGKFPWWREWLLTSVFLSGEFCEWRSLAGYSPWGRKESDVTEWLTVSHFKNKNPSLYTFILYIYLIIRKIFWMRKKKKLQKASMLLNYIYSLFTYPKTSVAGQCRTRFCGGMISDLASFMWEVKWVRSNIRCYYTSNNFTLCRSNGSYRNRYYWTQITRIPKPAVSCSHSKNVHKLWNITWHKGEHPDLTADQ